MYALRTSVNIWARQISRWPVSWSMRHRTVVGSCIAGWHGLTTNSRTNLEGTVLLKLDNLCWYTSARHKGNATSVQNATLVIGALLRSRYVIAVTPSSSGAVSNITKCIFFIVQRFNIQLVGVAISITSKPYRWLVWLSYECDVKGTGSRSVVDIIGDGQTYKRVRSGQMP